MKRLLIAFLLLMGCSLPGPEPLPVQNPARAVLILENDSWTDLTLYIWRAGSRMRVGRCGAVNVCIFETDHVQLRGRWQFELLPLGMRHTRLYRELDLPPVGTTYYRFLGEGAPLGVDDRMVRIRVLDNLNGSYVKEIR